MPASSPQQSNQKGAIRHTFDLDVSDISVRRRLRSAGLRSRIASQKLLLTTGNKNARLHFATQHASWTTEDWGRGIFSDESTFCTRLDQRERVWRLQEFRPTHRATAGQMWTAISDEWEQLWADQAFVSALYQSLPSRIEAVNVGDGEMTLY
ncbi:hypothetical protein HPB48_006666 [Haemaphysalis longicornis]|uniref:Transposase Tc1-like domain-containing protein n=1 Tax=Haemaphysalis longicornis TaxID=44386 RepID=A0A9J6FAU6_HAELO|nr:hypothetical protein HPB48_006666 [Haemaphysalis longicornis]